MLRRFDLCAAPCAGGQIDISARLIWVFENLGWATEVGWPTPARLARMLDPAPS